MLLCQKKIGEEVPQSYYLAKVKPTPKDYMISLDVPKRKKIKFEHEITQVNSILRYSTYLKRIRLVVKPIIPNMGNVQMGVYDGGL